MIDSKDLFLSSYDYGLPPEFIAQVPVEPRHDARLMVLPKFNEDIDSAKNLKVWDLIKLLNPGDLLVINDTRVLKARLKVRLEARKRLAELLLLEPKGSGKWLCLAKPAKKMQIGDHLFLEALGHKPLVLKVVDKDQPTGGRIIQFPEHCVDSESIEGLLEEYGEIPLPPYIQRHEPSDAKRYQTTFATRPGAVAAPTAGLHLSQELLIALSQRGIKLAKVTLHVGLGTFRPLEVEDLSAIKLHTEWAEIKKDAVKAISECRSRGNRVIAIGTTTVRTLEASYLRGNGSLIPFVGMVDLVIKPGYKFGVVDGLLTNFHLPKSSLLLLVSAFIGRERLLAFYGKAIAIKYRFFSYGDAMLILPGAVLPRARV